VLRGGWLLALLVAVVASACTSTAVTCPTGQTSCGGACVDLATDTLHCGACNVSCSAGATCSAGSCACPTGQTSCGLLCVNKQTDPANCGTCGHSCGLGTCAAGACLCNTTPTTVGLCPNDPATGTCVDKASSGANCGTCGNVCVPATTCSTGTCQCLAPNTTCQAGTPSEVCTNLQTDRANCGSCGHACGSGYTCAAGACQLVCATDRTSCNGVCVDTRTDPANCGTCGNACGSGKSCAAGTCQAACTTLTCGGVCCQAPTAGNLCCPTAGSETCPSVHQNFIGTDVQTYYSCTPSNTYDVLTASFASGTWAGDFGLPVSAQRACPDTGGSLCVVRQKGFGATAYCGVWCYEGPLAAALQVTQGYACPCPTQLRTDWY
jgi:hypothetical protein